MPIGMKGSRTNERIAAEVQPPLFAPCAREDRPQGDPTRTTTRTAEPRFYVDALAPHGLRYRGRLTETCHLITDAPDLEPLHLFAERLGLHRAWLHRGSFPHYDLTPGVRARAIDLGAVELDRAAFVALVRTLRNPPPLEVP